MSQTTKRALSESLKKLMQQKPLNKITINDIAEECGVNRMTFYYHFKDIYDLVEWICREDLEKALADKKTYDTWQEGFYQIFEQVRNNRWFVINVYRSVSHEQIENNLHEAIRSLIMGIMDERPESVLVSQRDREFIADFYKFAFAGIILDWVRNDMKEDPHEIIDRLSCLISGSLSAALDRFRVDREAAG